MFHKIKAPAARFMISTIKKGFICLALQFVLIPAYTQTKIFVSPHGSDASKGTLQRPFKTIKKAVAVATEKTGAIVITLKGGTYYLDAPVIIASENFRPSSLAIQNNNNETVRISAGQKLQLQWRPYRNGIYKAVVPAGVLFERLYVNDRLQVLARYPNYDSTARIFNGTAADAISPQRVKGWSHPAGGYVHALHNYEWGSFHYRITGVKADGGLQLEGGWQNNRPAAPHKQYRFVENIFEELDAPGEWFLNRSTNELYYYPLPGTDIKKARIEVSRFKNSMELSGSATKPLRNVHLKGLLFLHNERSFMDTREPLVRSDWTIYRGGTLLLDGTENCSVRDCSFDAVGGNAIMVSNYNKQDTISGCHIRNIGASAVCFVGNAGALRSPSFKYEKYIPYNKLDTLPGPVNNNYPQQCVVTNNLLHNIGCIEKQATGVEIEMASEITVSYNSIYNTPRAGINIGDGAFGGHIIEHNDVFNTVLETGDHGAFNSWGRDRYWASNRHYMDSLAAAHPGLILLDAQKQTVIRNNRFRCDHGWDIDLDDGSSNYAIYNNVCLNGGLKLREGFYRIVKNNILINNSFHPHVWFQNSGDVFEHNIVMKPYMPISIKWWGHLIDYNLFPDSIALQAAQNNGTDKNSIAGDPMFTNASKGDYTVTANSPALQIGFKNFLMKFGVQNPSLKKIALHPAIPLLIKTNAADKEPAITGFLGGTIKSVNGLGDRSSYGLPDEKGVVIITAGDNSLLTKSGLRDKDVIRNANGKPVENVRQLLKVYEAAKNFSRAIPLEVIRDQNVLKLQLRIR